jgi:hypothetical protein
LAGTLRRLSVAATVEQRHNVLSGDTERVDETSRTSTRTADPSLKCGHKVEVCESFQHATPGTVTTTGREIMEVQASKLIAGQDADGGQVAQNGRVAFTESLDEPTCRRVGDMPGRHDESPEGST